MWLLSGDRERFGVYEDFPWSLDQKLGAILDVQEPRPGHYYWP